MDFSETYWHVDCVRTMSLSAFTEHYRKWCKRKGYLFQAHKPEEIYTAVQDIIPVLPKNDLTKMLVKQAVEQLNATSKVVEELRSQMNEMASLLPEYAVVMSMKGVGPSLGPQIMAEIGDVTRFTHRGALTAFAGVDPGVNALRQLYAEKCFHFKAWFAAITQGVVSGYGFAHQDLSC